MFELNSGSSLPYFRSMLVGGMAFMMLGGLSSCTKKEATTPSTENPATTQAVEEKPASSIASDTMELKIEDLVVGNGAEAKSGKPVKVHYTGWLTNGKKFDSSVDRGQPFRFLLGGGQVIQGWDKGVAGMKVGGKRKLTIPPQMGYGDRGAGNVIPPNATLVFEVELLGVE